MKIGGLESMALMEKRSDPPVLFFPFHSSFSFSSFVVSFHVHSFLKSVYNKTESKDSKLIFKGNTQ